MPNVSPAVRGWQLLQEMENAYFQSNYEKAEALAEMVSAYVRIPDASTGSLLVVWFVPSAVTGQSLQETFTLQSVTGAVAPTDAEVVWDFGEGAGQQTVTTKALTNNVATLTTAAPPNILVGQLVFVTVGDVVFDGLQTVTAVAGNTFSYAKTNANVASVGATGTAKPAGNTHTHLFTANGTYFVKVVVDTAALPAVTYGHNVSVPYSS